MDLDETQVERLNTLLVEKPASKPLWGLFNLSMIGGVILYILFRGDPYFKSVVNITLCSIPYWIIFGVFILL